MSLIHWLNVILLLFGNKKMKERSIMKKSKKTLFQNSLVKFTLIELLVVIAMIAILPVQNF